MSTQQPEALRLAAELDETPDFAVDPNMVDDLAAELRRQHARIAELESQLEAVDADGVSPLIPAKAQPAGAAPVAWRYQTPTGWHATTDSRAAARIRDHHSVDPLYAAPQPATQALDADPLQPAANWLVQAHAALEVSTLSGKLSIGYNRARRLYDAAIAAQKGCGNG